VQSKPPLESPLTYIDYTSYIIVKDLEGKGYLVMKNAGNDLWPKLLHQYSSTGHTKALPMVYGEFTSKPSKGGAAHSASSTLSVGASASSAPAKATARAPTRVNVKGFIAGGQPCYSWKRHGVDEHGYAQDWTTLRTKQGFRVFCIRRRISFLHFHSGTDAVVRSRA